MAVGPLKRHPTSGALLLTPARLLQRCGVCCEDCLYAIRADPCYQELDEDCRPLVPPIWLCLESKCLGAEEDFGDIKTPVTFLYAAPGDTERCYQTIPSSITLTSKLAPEIVAGLITDTSLVCVEDGCAAAACGDPEDVCHCLCKSADNDGDGIFDCCMSRWANGAGPAPWTFTYRRTVVSEVFRTNVGGGIGVGDCVALDCTNNASCVYFAYEEEIDEAELLASYDPITEQPCTKHVPLRGRVTERRLGLIGGFRFACCSEPNDPTDWAPAGSLIVDPPVIVAREVDVNDSGIMPGDDGCFSRLRITRTREGDCAFYREELVEELWSYANSAPGVCGCQELQRTTTITEYEFFAETDEIVARLCAQCRRYLTP